ncbi:hypothetical protein GGI15_002585 [Coemansia interrupta]|uniref:DUF7707 domain-containing protein n=1 Tax=Coemansia interrupta TaxID=1126814 RepID=A0A9W8HIX4_9FUNG|nr:hypothetical protein GGI15_002585 [Coemansia interrupta]
MLVKSCVLAGIVATACGVLAADGGADAGAKHAAAPGTQKKRAAALAAASAHADKGVRVLRSSASKGKKRHNLRSSGFNANDVDIDVRITWCNDNTNFCDNVCLNKTWGAPINDACEASDLQWHCTCGNGKNPDPDVYTFPVMHYQCQYEVYQCQNNCATGDIRCTQECQGDRNCTAPKDPNFGKTALPETDDGESGLDTQDAGSNDPVNFFSDASSMISTGGYIALTALVATSLHVLGLP